MAQLGQIASANEQSNAAVRMCGCMVLEGDHDWRVDIPLSLLPHELGLPSHMMLCIWLLHALGLGTSQWI